MIFKRKENNKKIRKIIKNGLKAVRDINKIDGEKYKIKIKLKKAQEKLYKLSRSKKAFYKIRPKITRFDEQIKEFNKQIIILEKAKKIEVSRSIFYSYYSKSINPSKKIKPKEINISRLKAKKTEIFRMIFDSYYFKSDNPNKIKAKPIEINMPRLRCRFYTNKKNIKDKLCNFFDMLIKNYIKSKQNKTKKKHVSGPLFCA